MSKTNDQPAGAGDAPKVQRQRRRPYQAQPEPPAAVDEAPLVSADQPPRDDAPPPDAAQDSTPNSAASAELDRRAGSLVANYAVGAAALGFLPLPLVDMVALAALQLKMLAEIYALHQRGFSPGAGRAMLAMLAGSLLPVSAAVGVRRWLVHWTPLVGLGLGVIALPSFTGAATLALGKLCHFHLAMGVDPLTMDPAILRRELRAELRRAAEAESRA